MHFWFVILAWGEGELAGFSFLAGAQSWYNNSPMLYKVDFHVHTPASSCYLDHTVTGYPPTQPQQIVRAAREARLAAVVLVDHNTARGLEPVREAADQQVVIFPGIEISAKGGHLLAVFDRDTPISWLERLVRELGFRPEQEGQGYEEAPLWLDQVFERVAGAGGIAIAAHVDRRPRGFVASEELKREEKRRIYSSPFLAGIEITIPMDKPLWTAGQMPGYPLGRGCVQGSDAHAPEEMGRRPVFLEVPYLGLAGLRLALEEPERVKFPQEAAIPR